MQLPGLNLDTIVIQRQAETADAEGNPTGALSQTYSGPCTYGTPSPREQSIGQERGQQIDAVAAGLPVGTDVQPGDVATLRGSTWDVIYVEDVRLHLRILLRGSLI